MEPELIESRPDIMMGKPVVRGTRITVESILEKLAAGESIDDVLSAHPRLSREGVLAAIAFYPVTSMMMADNGHHSVMALYGNPDEWINWTVTTSGTAATWTPSCGPG